MFCIGFKASTIVWLPWSPKRLFDSTSPLRDIRAGKVFVRLLAPWEVMLLLLRSRKMREENWQKLKESFWQDWSDKELWDRFRDRRLFRRKRAVERYEKPSSVMRFEEMSREVRERHLFRVRLIIWMPSGPSKWFERLSSCWLWK